MLFVEVMICSRRLFFTTLLSALPTPSLTQGGQICCMFGIIFNSGKQIWIICLNNLSVSCADSSLYQREPIFCRPLVKGGGFSLEKPEGLTLIQQPNSQLNIVYKQNVFQSLSQLPLTALFTKESLAIRLG